MLWTKGLFYLAIGIIVIALITTGISGTDTAEAKSKNFKEFQWKIYLFNARTTGHAVTLHVCLADDNGKCHGEKTVNSEKIINKAESRYVYITTLKFKEDKFTRNGDVDACAYLNEAGDFYGGCAYGVVHKVKKNIYKSEIDYQRLLSTIE